MTVIAAEPFAIAEQKEVLKEIWQEECSLAVWQRDVPVDVSGLLESDVKNVCVTVPSHCPETRLREELRECGYPNGVTGQKLIQDILSICNKFHELTASPSIEIRLEIITGNSCWKFHSDYVELRLITTYLGSGTQWIDDQDPGHMTNEPSPEAIKELGIGDIGLFKGRLGKGRPAIHRSPPIDGTGEKRLLLVLNPVED